MLSSAILSILASANLFLTPQDPEPWEHLVPDLEARIVDSIKTAPLRCIAQIKTANVLRRTDTTDHWIDGRGRCRSTRSRRTDVTSGRRILTEWGIHSGLPSDSVRLEEWTDRLLTRSEFQYTPQDPNRRITLRTTGSASGLFADSLVLARTPQGRLLSRLQMWGGMFDSLRADFDSIGSITGWRISSDNGWGFPFEAHYPQWDGNLLKSDSSITLSFGSADQEVFTIHHVACTWNDSSLIGCGTHLPVGTTSIMVTSGPYRNSAYYTPCPDVKPSSPSSSTSCLVDSISILRDASGHPLHLRSTFGKTLRRNWDSQGRLLSTYRRLGVSIAVDSLEYEGTSPLPSLQRTVTTNQIEIIVPSNWDTVTTYSWSTKSLAGISAHRAASLSSRIEGRTLRIEGLTGSATLRLSDLSGRLHARLETSGKDVQIELPAGTRLLVWDVRDASGTVIGQGRLTTLR